MSATTRDPVETALLARLLVAARKVPSEADVLRSLRPLFSGVDDARTDALLRAALARLETQGLREPGAMTLTRTGKKRACEALGVPSTKVPTQWRALKSTLLEVAVGRPTNQARRALTPSAIRATALAKKLGLETPTTRPSDVLDAWAARELGMEGKRLTIANVRAHVLARALGIDTLRDPKRIGAVATAHVLGVPRTDASTIRDAILRDWLGGEKPPARAVPVQGAAAVAESKHDAEPPLAIFASAVRELARATTDGRFGRYKVFIAPIWSRARSDASFGEMSEDEFKAKLVEAHRSGLLRLSRADLTPAMAPEVVADSEVPYLNAVFHFVDLEGTLS